MLLHMEQLQLGQVPKLEFILIETYIIYWTFLNT